MKVSRRRSGRYPVAAMTKSPDDRADPVRTAQRELGPTTDLADAGDGCPELHGYMLLDIFTRHPTWGRAEMLSDNEQSERLRHVMEQKRRLDAHE